ncbi:MAG: GAF and ANTAR domain-containing protein [Actinobacteria bacterium]|nr:GAF and ANTAR domain-containing protein [Actinomycetota bacterium]
MMLERVALIATETVPGCDLASITMLKRGTPATPVCTDKAALALDETQYEAGDGPCLAAIRHRGVEEVSIAVERRWPPFTSEARKRGVQSVLSVPLGDPEVVHGALNLYSRSRPEYDDAARTIACLFADQVGIAAANASAYAEAYELSHQLREAMESRAVIEQAKGILIAAQRCTPEQAFDILKRASQNQNRKVRAVAVEIVERHAGRPNGS